MKKIIFLLCLISLSIYSYAQLNGDGYYRVQNYGSHRYAYLCDRTGYINYGTQNADIGAIQLWSGLERTYDDPASIIYVKNVGGDRYDLQAQGTGLYDIIGHYVQIQVSGNNQYYVYASSSGITKYLSDSRTNDKEEGVPSFDGKGNYRLWSVFSVNENDNYLGITPTITAEGKHYTSFYASFPFRKISSGLKVYYIKHVDANAAVAVMEEVTADIIPGGMPLIVECPSTTSVGNKIMPVTGGGAALSNNLLHGVYFCNPDRVSDYVGTPFDKTTMRALTILPNGKIGFDASPANLTTIEIKYKPYQCLPANTAYLAVSADTPTELRMLTQAEYEAYLRTLGVDNVNANKEIQTIYTLDGREVNGLQRGVNIIRSTDGSIKKILKK